MSCLDCLSSLPWISSKVKLGTSRSHALLRSQIPNSEANAYFHTLDEALHFLHESVQDSNIGFVLLRECIQAVIDIILSIKMMRFQLVFHLYIDVAKQSATAVSELYSCTRVKKYMPVNLPDHIDVVQDLNSALKRTLIRFERDRSRGMYYRLEQLRSVRSENLADLERYKSFSCAFTDAQTAIRLKLRVKEPSTGLNQLSSPDLDLSNEVPNSANARGGRVQVARINYQKGEVRRVLVQSLDSSMSLAEFRALYGLLSQFNHNHIAHLYGISARRCPTRFLVFDNTADILPYNVYRTRVRGDQYIQFDKEYEVTFNSAWRYLGIRLDGLAIEQIFCQVRMVKQNGQAIVFVPPPPMNATDRRNETIAVLKVIHSMLDRRLAVVPKITRCVQCLPETQGFYMGLLKAIRRVLVNVGPAKPEDIGEEYASMINRLFAAEEALSSAALTVYKRSQSRPYVHKLCGFCGRPLINSEEMSKPDSPENTSLN